LTAQAATQKKVRLLISIALPGLTLRYAASQEDLVFPHGGATTWTAKGWDFSDLAVDMEGTVGRISVRLDNVTSDMGSYADSYFWPGAVVSIYRIYLDADNHAPVTATEYDEVFVGKVEGIPKIEYTWMRVDALSGTPITRGGLIKKYGRLCYRIFGDTDCNVDGNADLTALTANGTADSGTTTTLTDIALTEADDFWNGGRVTITTAAVVWNRLVKDFDAASDTITLDVALPVAVGGTSTYTVYKGCDKTWATCSHDNAWGPSADNSANFGGCLHIGKQTDL